MIQLAGNRITQLIEENIGIPYPSADEFKRVYSDVYRDLSLTSIDELDYKVNTMVRKGMNELVTELKRSFEYFYLQQQDETELSKLIVSGGGSKLKNLFPYLNQELKIKVIPCPQPENVICSPVSLMEFSESLPIYNVALGLALREVTEGAHTCVRINLLPADRPIKPAINAVKTKKTTKPDQPGVFDNPAGNTQMADKKNNVLIYFFMGLLLLGSLVFLLSTFFDYDLSKGELVSLTEQVTEYRNRLANARKLKLAASQIENQQPEWVMVTRRYRPWPAIFNGLTSALPEAAWLTGIEGTNEGGIIVKGRSLTFMAVADFIKNLQGNTIFNNIKLKEIKQVSPEIMDYIFTLEIEAGGTSLDSKK